MQRDDRGEARKLEQRDELVAGRRDDDSDRLRDDHAQQDAGPRHPECPAGQLLTRVDREQPRADDLGHVGGLVQRERDECPSCAVPQQCLPHHREDQQTERRDRRVREQRQRMDQADDWLRKR